MKTTSLVSLDCKNGHIRRYMRVEGNKPLETGRDKFKRWIVARKHEDKVFDLIQEFRVAYEPPDAPTPRPTPPLKTAMRAAA